jgi:Mrp family chromosome partitioning ATPase
MQVNYLCHERKLTRTRAPVYEGRGIITTANFKGGVGKSTIAVHLAVWLYEKGRHVILVDADMQQSTSRWIKTSVPR